MIIQRMFANLEEYEEYDSKRLAKMTKNQKHLALEDERAKAKRNRARIINEVATKRATEGAAKGKESGRKHGKKVGTVVGGLLGGLGSVAAVTGLREKLSKAGTKGKVIAGLGTAGVTVGSALLGRHIGKKSGERNGEREGYEEGKRKGAIEGGKLAKEQGHDEVTVLTRNARIFDEYERKHRGEDNWETGVRKMLLEEEEARKAEEAKKRAEELERKRVQAEQERAAAERRRAEAEEERARTDRERYWDEHFGLGQYSRDRQGSGTSYTQNNYYGRRDW